MTGWRNPELQEWLDAEAARDDDRADRAFASVFAHQVPRLEPATAVWDAEPVHSAVAGRHRWWLAVAAGLLLTVGGLAAAAFWSAWVFDLLGTAGWLGPRVLARGTAIAGQVVDLVHHAWLPAVAVGRAIGLAAATGPAAAAIAAHLTIALAAAFGLSRLLSPEEE